MGFLSRGCHLEQACLEQEPSGEGQFSQVGRAGVVLPLYMLCGQGRKGLTRRKSPFTDTSSRTCRVLRSLWATPVEDLTCCCSQSGKHWRGCCESKALVVQIIAIQFCSSYPVSYRYSLVPVTFKDSWFSLCFALLFVFCFFYMTVSVVLAFFF